MDRIDVDDGELVGETRLARQGWRFGSEGWVPIGVSERAPHRRDEIRIERLWRCAAADSFDPVEQDAGRNLLTRLPSGERLGVVDGEKVEPIERHILQFDRRGKSAQQRGYRRLRHLDETKSLTGFAERDDARPLHTLRLRVDA